MRTSQWLAWTLLATPLLAQERVEERRAAAKDGRVEIENPAGSVTVIGWDKAEVAVTGTLGQGAEGLSLSGGGRTTRIEVETAHNPFGTLSDLEIHVPNGSRVEVESFAAKIKVSEVKGGVHANTVKGDISVTGAAKEVELETVSGSLEISGSPSRVRAQSVNGRVAIHGGGGDIEASTVNGELLLDGLSCEACRFETVNGDLRFEGSLGPRANLEAQSVSGTVELRLPGDVSAEFSVTTWSGEVENELGPAARKASRYTPSKELRFSTGAGGARVEVETMSGTVRLKKR